ncbi:hypothetical protein [Clostridium estertheticum]|nr:hypothetical protein [Clostridium estertheticum]
MFIGILNVTHHHLQLFLLRVLFDMARVANTITLDINVTVN